MTLETRPFDPLPPSVEAEKRGEPRRCYPFRQKLAPLRYGLLPRADAFVEATFRELSPSGVSFELDAPPDFDEAVIQLGTGTNAAFVVAKIVHVERLVDGDQTRFVVGCELGDEVTL